MGGTSLDAAKKDFKKKYDSCFNTRLIFARYKDKSANNWEDRHNFVSKPGKYTQIDM